MVSALSLAAKADDDGDFYHYIALAPAPAPAEPIEMQGGRKVSLAAFRGKVVVLNLWANWCGPCMRELPTLDALEKELGEKGLVVIPLSVDELTYAGARKLLDGKELALPHLAKGDRFYDRNYGRDGLPATLIIGRDGLLKYKYLGSADWTTSEQKDVLEKLLAQGK